jgi:PAS domain S-box-containing protein
VLKQSSLFSRLRGLLEVTRLVRTGSELPDVLSAIARTVGESLGFRTVAITLRRREWDDFVVTTVHGREEAQAALLGQVRQPAEWNRLLDTRFLQRGAYVVPSEDAIFVPMRADDGTLLGILSVDEPMSGRRPSGDETEVLVAVAEHAALAVQAAQEATQAQRHREALERLLEVSTRLTGTWETSELLQLVCESIADALRFERVSLLLLDPAEGNYAGGASVGFAEGEDVGSPLRVAELDLLLAPSFEVEGCYVIPHEEARKVLPSRPAGYRSQRDGRGPDAWQNHWLFVPLHDSRGLRIGYIWADDPVDRLVPTPQWLQLLRTFANQATTALSAAAQHEAKDAILRTALDCVVTVDAHGRIVDFNPAAEEILGWTRADAVGRALTEIAVADEHRDSVDETLRAGSGPLLGTSYEIAALRTGATPFPAEITVNRVDVPGRALYAVSLRDVTRLKERELRLRDAEAKYRALVEQLPLATYVNEIGLPIRTRSMSPQIEAMLGYPASSWLEPGFFWRCVHPADRARVAVDVERTHSIGERFRAEYRLVAADGRVVWVLDETVPVRDEEFRPLFLQGFLLDVTDRLPAERQLTAVAASA